MRKLYELWGDRISKLGEDSFISFRYYDRLAWEHDKRREYDTALQFYEKGLECLYDLLDINTKEIGQRRFLLTLIVILLRRTFDGKEVKYLGLWSNNLEKKLLSFCIEYLSCLDIVSKNFEDERSEDEPFIIRELFEEIVNLIYERGQIHKSISGTYTLEFLIKFFLSVLGTPNSERLYFKYFDIIKAITEGYIQELEEDLSPINQAITKNFNVDAFLENYGKKIVFANAVVLNYIVILYNSLLMVETEGLVDEITCSKIKESYELLEKKGIIRLAEWAMEFKRTIEVNTAVNYKNIAEFYLLKRDYSSALENINSALDEAEGIVHEKETFIWKATKLNILSGYILNQHQDSKTVAEAERLATVLKGCTIEDSRIFESLARYYFTVSTLKDGHIKEAKRFIDYAISIDNNNNYTQHYTYLRRLSLRKKINQ